jgi:hypothetical protein
MQSGKTLCNLFAERQSAQTQLHDFHETTEMNKNSGFCIYDQLK